MRTKLCSRCNQELPTTDFPLRPTSPDGLYSQCRECRRQARQESKDRYPHFKEIQLQEKHSKYYDPIRYSASVCAHVADYVSRAVTRFETHTGMEAPPHMAALVQVAKSFVSEHPPPSPRVRTCPDCRASFESSRGKRTCDECGRERRRSRERQHYARKKERSIR